MKQFMLTWLGKPLPAANYHWNRFQSLWPISYASLVGSSLHHWHKGKIINHPSLELTAKGLCTIAEPRLFTFQPKNKSTVEKSASKHCVIINIPYQTLVNCKFHFNKNDFPFNLEEHRKQYIKWRLLTTSNNEKEIAINLIQT